MTTSLTRSTTNSRAPVVGGAGPMSVVSVAVAAAATGALAHPHARVHHHHHNHSHMFSTTTTTNTHTSTHSNTIAPSPAPSYSACSSFRGSNPTKRPLLDAENIDSRPAKRARILQVVSKPPRSPPSVSNVATVKRIASPLAPPAQPPRQAQIQAAHISDQSHAHASGTTTTAPIAATLVSPYTAYRFSTATRIAPPTTSPHKPRTSLAFRYTPPAEAPPHIPSSESADRQQASTQTLACSRRRSKPKTQRLHPQSPPSDPAPDIRIPHYKKLRANALRSELHRLQASGTATPVVTTPNITTTSEPRDEGRKLRSQEALRFKSDLSAYFPDYDEIIGNDVREEHTLTFDAPIVIYDSATADSSPPPNDSDVSIRHYHGDLYANLNAAHHIDLSALEAHCKDTPAIADPLPDAFFGSIHRKAERVEKHIRNTERGRAHHEHAQVARLLDELQGHDWLRTMGVSGVTASQKRKYEPARDYFIGGCEAIIDKFKQWTREEKRRKAEKDRALAERAAADEDESDDDGSAAETAPRRRGKGKSAAGPNSPIKIMLRITNDAIPGKDGRRRKASRITIVRGNYYDDQQEAAENDHIEVEHASEPAAHSTPPPQPKDITSFFKKQYERDLWLNRQRPPGRKVMAWGVLIPDLTNREFRLGKGVLDEETVKLRDTTRRERTGRH